MGILRSMKTPSTHICRLLLFSVVAVSSAGSFRFPSHTHSPRKGSCLGLPSSLPCLVACPRAPLRKIYRRGVKQTSQTDGERNTDKTDQRTARTKNTHEMHERESRMALSLKPRRGWSVARGEDLPASSFEQPNWGLHMYRLHQPMHAHSSCRCH